jgi:hypothetical protein
MPSPHRLLKIPALAINTFYTKRIKTKREAGKVLLLKILNVNSVPLNFIYNWKTATNTVSPLPMPVKQWIFRVKNDTWHSKQRTFRQCQGLSSRSFQDRVKDFFLIVHRKYHRATRTTLIIFQLLPICYLKAADQSILFSAALLHICFAWSRISVRI